MLVFRVDDGGGDHWEKGRNPENERLCSFRGSTGGDGWWASNRVNVENGLEIKINTLLGDGHDSPSPFPRVALLSWNRECYVVVVVVKK